MHDAAITTLQLAAARAWPAPICRPLGDWWLRSAEGFTGRGNSALPLGDPGLPLDQALDQVETFYRELGFRPAVEVPLPLRSDVRAALRDRGWQRQTMVYVQSTKLLPLVAATPTGAEFDLLDAPSDEHLRMLRESRRMLPGAAMHLLTGVRPVVFAECRRDRELVCRARGSVTDGWLGLIGIETAASAQRQGLATAAVGRLARWALDHGATDAFLQVDHVNTGSASAPTTPMSATHRQTEPMGYRDVVLRYFDMWNSGDTTGIDDIIDPDWIDHAHPDIRGPGGVRDSIVAIKSAQPRLHFHLDHVLDDTDMIAVAGSVHGASTRLMWLIRIRAGRMAEMWTYRGVDA